MRVAPGGVRPSPAQERRHATDPHSTATDRDGVSRDPRLPRAGYSPRSPFEVRRPRRRPTGLPRNRHRSRGGCGGPELRNALVHRGERRTRPAGAVRRAFRRAADRVEFGAECDGGDMCDAGDRAGDRCALDVHRSRACARDDIRFSGGGLPVDGTRDGVGGTNRGPSATVEAYDPATDTWTSKAAMPTARWELGVAVVNGIIYAVGGQDAEPNGLTTVEAYDPATDTWTTKAPMPTGRYRLGVAAVNGVLYAVGGLHGLTGVDIVEAYDPVTDTWTTKAPLPTALASVGAAEL